MGEGGVGGLGGWGWGRQGERGLKWEGGEFCSRSDIH